MALRSFTVQRLRAAMCMLLRDLRPGQEVASGCTTAVSQGSPVDGLSLSWGTVERGITLARSYTLTQLRLHQTSTKPQPQQQAGAEGIPLTEQEQHCWSCDHRFKKGGIVCTGCKKIQPLDLSLNYFELLGMPSMQYNIDLDRLEKQYKHLQWSIHPDRMARHSPQEKEFSADSATQVNMAYSVLRNPLSRANYMLAQRGITAGEGREHTITDTEFLTEMMEAREEVEETDDPALLHQLLTANRQQQQEVQARLGRAFESPSGSRDAAHLTARLAYLARIEEEIVRKLPHDSA